MHLGLASLESIAMSIGAHVKELDLGGQENGGKTPKKNHGTFVMTRANCQPPPGSKVSLRHYLLPLSLS